MAKRSVIPVAYTATQSDVDTGAFTSLSGGIVMVVDANGQDTGVRYEVGPANTPAIQTVTSSGNASGGGSLKAWAAATAVEAGEIRRATVASGTIGIGDFISSNAARTTGAAFDATEAANWTELPDDPDLVTQASLMPSLATKQDVLVSGTNIKTVNGASLLGSGDIPSTATVINSAFPSGLTAGATITASTPLTTWNTQRAVDASGGDVHIFLPTAVSQTGFLSIVRIDSSVNNVWVYANSLEGIAGLHTNASAVRIGALGSILFEATGGKATLRDWRNPLEVSRLWMPTELTGLAAQYSADSLSAFASGAAIDTWNDTSGNSRNATQATAGARPTRHATQLNGYNVASFDGTDDRIATTTFPATDWGTTDHVVLSVARIAVSGIDVIGAGNAGDGAFLIGNYVGNKMRAHAWRGATANTIDGATALTLNTWHIVGERLSGANLAVRLDGEQDATITMSGTSGAGAPTEFVLGSRASTVTSPIFSGQIAETLVLLATVANADLARVDGYLAHKFALKDNLAAGHAYKVAPPIVSIATY